MARDNVQLMVSLNVETPIWNHFYMVSPLVVIGTKDDDQYNLAPKHMAMAMGQENYFGFICTPRHRTYHNIKRYQNFAVSFPRPNQIVNTSLAATPRSPNDAEKYILTAIPSEPSLHIDAPCLCGAYLIFECTLDRIIDGFGTYSLVVGEIIAARVAEDSLRQSDEDEQAMIYQNPMLAYLAYGRFSEIKETTVFPFHKNFDDLPK